MAQVVEVAFKTGMATHTLEHNVLYSLRQEKFIKGFSHKGSYWAVEYRVLPGYYLLWSIHGFKDDRGLIFSIRKIRVKEDGGIEDVATIASWRVRLWELKEWVNDPSIPQSLKLFLECLPSGYHDIGCIPNPEARFSQGEVDNVVKWVNSKIASTAEY